MLTWKFSSYGGEARVLAIYIQTLDYQAQFYTMNGGWLHCRATSVYFSVPHFVEPRELDGLLPYLPTTDVPPSMTERPHSLSLVVPRPIGQPLIHKMVDFSNQADAAYQAHAAKLDNPHPHVAAYQNRFRYASLDEISSLLLPANLPKTNGKLPAPVLYAVHRSILTDGMGFKPPRQGTLRAGGNYEIMPSEEMRNIEFVKDVVRVYVDDKFATRSGTMELRPNPLKHFAIRAQQRIDRSRKTRPFTPHSIIGPFTKSEDAANEESPPNFNATDMRIVRFLESWAALGSFMSFSPLNSTAAAVLRAVDRYSEDIPLDKGTAWTFLQEIGTIAPWENRAAYDLRVPGTGLQIPGRHAEPTEGFVADKLKDIRHDWGSLPVYCVDDLEAREIDDGISIEAADMPDQYWLHIHVADPAAHIDPKSEVAEYAQSLVETVYMPERVTPMLTQSFVAEHLSLAPNRPCLTYSAKLNTDGELLDYKITPGMIRNVQFISPRVVEEVLQGSPAKKFAFHLVGPDLPPPKPRPMVETSQVTSHDKENLRLIQVIGDAHKAQRASRGGGDIFRLRPPERRISVSPNSPRRLQNGEIWHDPSIKMSAEIGAAAQSAPGEGTFDIVQPVMLLAGEVAARWCKDRGIPIVHRVTPLNEDSVDPAEFYAKNILPRMQDGTLDDALKMAYLRLLGSIQLSSTPGPHRGVGLSMIARCTSPLRRYPDLLLQWQVEAALLEEARLGQSLVGNTRDDFLPFPKTELDALLPHIEDREKTVLYGKRRAEKHWALQLALRACLFGEEDMPRTFSFVVLRLARHALDESAGITGVVSHFKQVGHCNFGDGSAVGEIQVGDIFEVEIVSINPYHQTLNLTPLRRLNEAEREKLDKENLLTMRSQDTIEQ